MLPHIIGLILVINFCVLFQRSQNLFIHVVTDGCFISVHVYDETEYDMLNKTVKETLDKKERYPMHVAVVKGFCCAYKHPIDYGGYSDSDIMLSQSNNDDLRQIQGVQQGSPHALSISNMHNMPVPSPILCG